MPSQQIKNYMLTFNLMQRADPECDIQFGMDFSLTHNKQLPLMQLIFPATSVGNNIANKWNIDNHNEGNEPQDLIFKNAGNGTIIDTPREISKRGKGTLWTEFSVFSVDIQNCIVHKNGVTFGYKINTDIDNPVTQIKEMKETELTEAQKVLVKNRCPYISFA